MRLFLGPLLGAVLVAGCSSVPVQPVQKVESNCDFALMNRVEQTRQAVLVERYWVHCPQARKSSS